MLVEQSGGPAPARSGRPDCVPVAFPCQSRGNTTSSNLFQPSPPSLPLSSNQEAAGPSTSSLVDTLQGVTPSSSSEPVARFGTTQKGYTASYTASYSHFGVYLDTQCVTCCVSRYTACSSVQFVNLRSDGSRTLNNTLGWWTQVYILPPIQ